MKRAPIAAAIAILLLANASCGPAGREPQPQARDQPQAPPASYFDLSAHPDAWSGGARKVAIDTAKGRFNVWIKRTGNNPRLKLLLLHGGPGATHEYFEAFDSFLPKEGVEYYYYDQLGSGRSDAPNDDDLWTVDRFVAEVDQVRAAIGGTKDNFCLLGHSWGGILAIEYALAHQDQLKCLVVSNMMASIPAYNDYADRVLKPQLDPASLRLVEELEATGKTQDPRYMGILMPQHYEKHFLRRPAAEWPDGVQRAFARINTHIYVLMQGPSELGASGRLEKWDRFADLKRIAVPTLVIAGRHDTMDPQHMAAMAEQLPNGELAMTEGSHMAFYDDQPTYFARLTTFLRKFR